MMDPAAYRESLDDYGILRPGALQSPARASGFLVFAQRSDARVEEELWTRHAAQFFETDLRFVVAKQYVFDPPPMDAALVSVTPAGGPEATRLCFGRPRQDDDLHAAEEAEARVGAAGLGGLARRCREVWLVEAGDDGDAASLRLAAILASVVLGPILSPGGQDLFGVRTARAKLEAVIAPYR